LFIPIAVTKIVHLMLITLLSPAHLAVFVHGSER
jgi:hypothetical protein